MENIHKEIRSVKRKRLRYSHMDGPASAYYWLEINEPGRHMVELVELPVGNVQGVLETQRVAQ